MAGLTNKGIKWEMKNSLWLIYSWIPLVYSAALMYIANRVDYKPFKIIANITLFLTMGALVIILVSLAADNENLGTGMILLLFLLHILTFVECLILRPKYLKLLALKEDGPAKRNVVEYLAEKPAAAVNPEKEVEKALKSAESKVFIDKEVSERLDGIKEVKKSEPEKTAVGGKVDINTCTADELASLPGLNLVDGKKAISHRAEIGGYKSVEEFVWFLGIKPHIAAPLHDLLVCGGKSEGKKESGKENETSVSDTGKSSMSINRTIDI